MILHLDITVTVVVVVVVVVDDLMDNHFDVVMAMEHSNDVDKALDHSMDRTDQDDNLNMNRNHFETRKDDEKHLNFRSMIYRGDGGTGGGGGPG